MELYQEISKAEFLHQTKEVDTRYDFLAYTLNCKKELFPLSESDLIEIQSYIEYNYSYINYYVNEKYFVIVLEDLDQLLNTHVKKNHFRGPRYIKIIKKFDEYFYISDLIWNDDKLTLAAYTNSGNVNRFYICDQIDGLMAYITDRLNGILMKKMFDDMVNYYESISKDLGSCSSVLPFVEFNCVMLLE